jgi:hypothetical protein
MAMRDSRLSRHGGLIAHSALHISNILRGYGPQTYRYGDKSHMWAHPSDVGYGWPQVVVTVTEIFRGNDSSYDVEAEKSAVWGGVLRLCNRLYMRTYYLRYIVTLILYWLERPIRCT